MNQSDNFHSNHGSADVYLASGSPRRCEILAQVGVNFSQVKTSVEESPYDNEPFESYVKRLALEKVESGWNHARCEQYPRRPVLGADTIGLFNQTILGKPQDQDHFIYMMRMLSGETHQVITAVAMTYGVQESVRHSITDVTFRTLKSTEILRYWNTGEPQDKACGYGIQGFGAAIVESISGSYSGVVGLPIEVTLALLEEYKIPWWKKKTTY